MWASAYSPICECMLLTWPVFKVGWPTDNTRWTFTNWSRFWKFEVTCSLDLLYILTLPILKNYCSVMNPAGSSWGGREDHCLCIQVKDNNGGKSWWRFGRKPTLLGMYTVPFSWCNIPDKLPPWGRCAFPAVISHRCTFLDVILGRCFIWGFYFR